MIRLLAIGIWVCVVALGSSYAAAFWIAASNPDQAREPSVAGLEFRRTPAITVPMVIDGAVKGYVLAKFVYTAEADTLRKLSVDPTVFVVHAAFEDIYVNGRVESGKISKYDLPEMLGRIRTATNTRLDGDVVREVLVDSLNYIDRTDLRSGLAASAAAAAAADGGRSRKPSH